MTFEIQLQSLPQEWGREVSAWGPAVGVLQHSYSLLAAAWAGFQTAGLWGMIFPGLKLMGDSRPLQPHSSSQELLLQMDQSAVSAARSWHCRQRGWSTSSVCSGDGAPSWHAGDQAEVLLMPLMPS